MRPKNQQQLLARNTPLFLQLHLAYHIGKVFGFEHQNNNNYKCKRFSAKLQWFNSISQLFKPSADLQYYSQLLSELHSSLRLNSSKARAVLAYVIMFNFSSAMCLSDVFILEDIAILNDILFDNCLKSRDVSKLHLNDMISTLGKMVKFCNANIVWNSLELTAYRGPVIPLLVPVHMRCTKEERLWLTDKFALVQVTVRSCKIVLYKYVDVPI